MADATETSQEAPCPGLVVARQVLGGRRLVGLFLVPAVSPPLLLGALLRGTSVRAACDGECCSFAFFCLHFVCYDKRHIKSN